MTERDVEQRLRAWYRAEIDGVQVPTGTLRQAVASIPTSEPVLVRRHVTGRGLTLLAAAALVVAGGAVVAGVGVERWRLPQPTSPAVVVASTPRPAPTTTPAPVPSATAEATVLGGGPILIVEDPRDGTGARIDMTNGPLHPKGTYDVFTLDAGTGARTSLGALSYSGHWNWRLDAQWVGPAASLLITNGYNGLRTLDSTTTAGQAIHVACCSQPDVESWQLSPQGDLLAGLHMDTNVSRPGMEGTTSQSDAVVITDTTGTVLRTIPLPSELDVVADALGSNLAWSPDGSAVVLAGCRPCNYADIGEPPTAAAHGRLVVVPIDGSPMHELLDVAGGGLVGPRWSADGRTIVVSRFDCPVDQIPPYCYDASSSIVSVGVADIYAFHQYTGDEQQVVLATVPDLGSTVALSPDGRHIAYSIDTGLYSPEVADTTGGIVVMDIDGSHAVRLCDGLGEVRWSPDSQWILFGGEWIVPAGGGERRSLDTHGSMDW